MEELEALEEQCWRLWALWQTSEEVEFCSLGAGQGGAAVRCCPRGCEVSARACPAVSSCRRPLSSKVNRSVLGSEAAHSVSPSWWMDPGWAGTQGFRVCGGSYVQVLWDKGLFTGLYMCKHK